jgi:hypothetical protein
MTKILHEDYLQETNDIISLEEWILTEKKVKKMGSYWDAMKRYGIVGLASYISGDRTIKDNATGGVLSVPLSVILYAGYRKHADACTDKCKDNILCKQRCYLKSCSIVIKEIYNSIQDVKSKVEKPKRVLKKLDKQLIKWVKRYNKHKVKIKKFSKDKPETIQNRYFGKPG